MVGNHFFIGLSERTNEEGAAQLASFLAGAGHTSETVPVAGRFTLEVRRELCWKRYPPDHKRPGGLPGFFEI